MLANAVIGIINALLSCLISFSILVINDVSLMIGHVEINVYLAPSSFLYFTYIYIYMQILLSKQ